MFKIENDEITVIIKKGDLAKNATQVLKVFGHRAAVIDEDLVDDEEFNKVSLTYRFVVKGDEVFEAIGGKVVKSEVGNLKGLPKITKYTPEIPKPKKTTRKKKETKENA